MDINAAIVTARNLCLLYEGLYLKPYLCPAGVPTIGVGATVYENGVRVQLTDPPITKDRALDLLDWMLETVYFPAVIKLCANIDEGRRAGAITDFAFNLGINALKNSTLRKKILANDWEGAKKEILKWNKGGGKVLSGLTKRRIAESRLL